MSTAIDAARAKRAEKQAELEALVAKASSEERTLTPEEGVKFEKLSVKIDELDERIASTVKAEERLAKAEAASAEKPEAVREEQVHVTRERRTYEEGDFGPARGGNSYLLDMAHIASAHLDSGASANAPAARERMARHAREVEVEARTDKNVRLALENAQRDIKSNRSGAISEYEQRVNPNTTAGTGGEFVQLVAA